jgi:hypothetical protein
MNLTVEFRGWNGSSWFVDWVILYDMILYDIIYIYNRSWVTPGGSSTSHIYTQTVHRIQRKEKLDCQFRWPRGIRRRTASPRLLGLRIRILPGVWGLSVANIVCCQLQVPVWGWSLVQRILTECALSECDCEVSIDYIHKHRSALESHPNPLV